MKRYLKNKNMLSDAELELLQQKRVCVVGCGGLGGYLIEMLSRLGIGALTVIDGDVFDETNLNRQLLSSEQNIGKYKAIIAEEHVASINSEVQVTAIASFLTAENAETLLRGHDLVFDGLDDIETRLTVEAACQSLGVPFVYGAIAGWYGQVAVIFPGDMLLEKIYSPPYRMGKEAELGNPSFSPALVASIQVSEGLKLMLQRGSHLRHQMLVIDLYQTEFEIVPL